MRTTPPNRTQIHDRIQNASLSGQVSQEMRGYFRSRRISGALRWLSPRSLQEQAFGADEEDKNESFRTRLLAPIYNEYYTNKFLTSGLSGTSLIYREPSATRWREPFNGRHG